MQGSEPQGEGGSLAHIAQILGELGPRYADDIARHSQFVKELYAPLLLARPRGGIAVTRGLAYGTHQRQVLDVFRPEGAREADVAVFVHGGAFVRGSRSAPEGVYDNVLTWCLRPGDGGHLLQCPWPRSHFREAARRCRCTQSQRRRARRLTRYSEWAGPEAETLLHPVR